MGASESAQAWEWPEGCLDNRCPRIEVLVKDDETGQQAWVPAVPQARITDRQGRNTHLCAEYRWHGEFYNEDFGPDRVRLLGQDAPVSTMRPAAVIEGGGGEPASEEGSDWQSWLLGGTASCGGRRSRGSTAQPGAPPAPAPAAAAPKKEKVRPQASAESLACNVCMDAPGDAVLVPCLHGGICRGCAKQIAENRAAGGARCPQCRTAIQGFVNAERPRRQRPPKANAPRRHRGQRPWRWPPWCLSQRPPLIEVYVGEVVGDSGRWVRAEPRSRIVDEEGHDRYLCAEYDWKGDRFVEDFEPDRVRRRGQALAVSELLLLE